MEPNNRSRTISLAAIALAMLAAVPHGVLAQSARGLLLANGEETEPDQLDVGQQLLLENTSTTLSFAGRPITLENFSGVFGYSAETAYVLVINGSATTGGQRARSGRILVIPPFGTQPDMASFDAARFAEHWTPEAAARHQTTLQQLHEVARRQRYGLFLGRLGRTTLNLAAPTGAQSEVARRSVVGDPAVMAIRYSSSDDYAAIARSVSEQILAALGNGDVASVAALLDPVPYGNTDLTGSGGDARRLTATDMIARHDWPNLLRGAVLQQGDDPGSWVATSPAAKANISLRRMGDFVFVSSISIDPGDAS